MAIAKLEIREGSPLLAEGKDLRSAVGKLLVARFRELELLRPGVYDVTPAIWTKNNHDHELTVFDNGEGLYKVLPKADDAGLLTVTQKGLEPYKPGGQQNPINNGNPIAIIGGGHPSKEGLHIFGLITYLEL